MTKYFSWWHLFWAVILSLHLWLVNSDDPTLDPRYINLSFGIIGYSAAMFLNEFIEVLNKLIIKSLNEHNDILRDIINDMEEIIDFEEENTNE